MNVQNVSTRAHKSTELSQIERITVSNAPHLPLIVVSPIVRCNYFVGAPQRATDHNLALGHAASRIIIKHRKKIEASLSLRSFIRHESDSTMCLYHFVKPKLNLSRWEQVPSTLRTLFQCERRKEENLIWLKLAFVLACVDCLYERGLEEARPNWTAGVSSGDKMED